MIATALWSLTLWNGINWHMGCSNNSDRMANSYSMSQHTFKCTIKMVFSSSGSNSTQQLDSVIFMWGKIYAPRFQTLSGKESDPRNWKKSSSPNPQPGWKAECDFNNCCEAGKPHQQTQASQEQQAPLLHKLSSWPVLGYRVQVREIWSGSVRGALFHRVSLFIIILLAFTTHLWVLASSFLRFRDHTQGRTTVGRTPLDEWSARRRAMPSAGFEPTIPAGERLQTHALDRSATGTGK